MIYCLKARSGRAIIEAKAEKIKEGENDKHQRKFCFRFWGVLVFLKILHFSPERKETGGLGATESEVWIGNFNVKAWKTTEHKLHKIWHSLKFCKNSGKRAHPCYRSVWMDTYISNLFQTEKQDPHCFDLLSSVKRRHAKFFRGHSHDRYGRQTVLPFGFCSHWVRELALRSWCTYSHWKSRWEMRPRYFDLCRRSSELQNDSHSVAINFNYTAIKCSHCMCTSMWIEKAGSPCWPPGDQQVLHLRRIWGINC